MLRALIRLEDRRSRASDYPVAALEWRVKAVNFSFLPAPLAREPKFALPTRSRSPEIVCIDLPARTLCASTHYNALELSRNNS